MVQRVKKVMKALCCVAIVLVCAPLAAAGSNGPYPTERVAEFVVDKLNVTSVPSEIWPKPEKGKKTLGDYGYRTQEVRENEALIQSPGGKSQISIKVLERRESGIYVCVDGQSQEPKGAAIQIQRVLLLKRKDAEGLLKGHVSSKEFASYPVIGGEDNTLPDT